MNWFVLENVYKSLCLGLAKSIHKYEQRAKKKN